MVISMCTLLHSLHSTAVKFELYEPYFWLELYEL